MTVTGPNSPEPSPPTTKHPVEAKVKASTASAGTISALLLAVLSVIQHDQLIAGLPDWVSVLLGAAVAALGTYAAGYNAPHTTRPITSLGKN